MTVRSCAQTQARTLTPSSDGPGSRSHRTLEAALPFYASVAPIRTRARRCCQSIHSYFLSCITSCDRRLVVCVCRISRRDGTTAGPAFTTTSIQRRRIPTARKPARSAVSTRDPATAALTTARCPRCVSYTEIPAAAKPHPKRALAGHVPLSVRRSSPRHTTCLNTRTLRARVRTCARLCARLRVRTAVLGANRRVCEGLRAQAHVRPRPGCGTPACPSGGRARS